MNKRQCDMCHKPVSGGIDTFGENGWDFCLSCWLEIQDMRAKANRLRSEYDELESDIAMHLALMKENEADKDSEAYMDAERQYHEATERLERIGTELFFLCNRSGYVI